MLVIMPWYQIFNLQELILEILCGNSKTNEKNRNKKGNYIYEEHNKSVYFIN